MHGKKTGTRHSLFCRNIFCIDPSVSRAASSVPKASNPCEWKSLESSTQITTCPKSAFVKKAVAVCPEVSRSFCKITTAIIWTLNSSSLWTSFLSSASVSQRLSLWEFTTTDPISAFTDEEGSHCERWHVAWDQPPCVFLVSCLSNLL